MEPTTADVAAPAASGALPAATTTAGLGLAVVAALYVLFSVGAGLAFQAAQLPGDVLHRVGAVAASAVDLRLGLTLVVAACLLAAARHLVAGAARSAPPGTGLPRATGSATGARAGGILVLVLAALAAVLALLALRAQYHQLDLRRTEATVAFHLSQVTYLVGSVGPAVIAVLVVLRAVLGGGGRR